MSHILLVEDESRMAATLQKGLGLAGYEVTVAASGLAARSMDVTEFDLVILDWSLPDFSGLDLLIVWRGRGYRTPILMLTARDQVADRVTGLEFGADDYMSKFFEWPELLARLQALLRRVEGPTESVGMILFDRLNQVFTDNGQVVSLTATEFRILKYFFDHPKKLVTRTGLIRAVYDQAANPYSNVIERHIKSIRQKFKYDPICTIRGLGYRLRSAAEIPTN